MRIIPPDYVDMGRSNEMRSNYAGVKVVKVVGVLPVHYPPNLLGNYREQWCQTVVSVCHNTPGN